MKRSILVIIILFTFINSSYCQEDKNFYTRIFNNIDFTGLPAVGLVDDSRSIVINPAGLTKNNDVELFFTKSIDTMNQFNGFLQISNIGFGFQQFLTGIEKPSDFKKFWFGIGFNIFDMMSVGVSYNYNQTVDNNLNYDAHSFDFGIMLRPTNFISIGGVVRNINNPKIFDNVINRSYSLGLALRPLGDRFTLTLDGIWDEGDLFNKTSGFLGIEIEPFEGFILRGNVDIYGKFGIDLGFYIPEGGIGYYRNFNNFISRDGIYGKVVSSRLRSVFQQRNNIAKIELTKKLTETEPIFSLFGNEITTSVWSVLYQLRRAEIDPDIAGIVVELGNLNSGLGMIEEIRSAIIDLKKTKKKVIFYLQNIGMNEYYLASIADKIIIHPTASLYISGLSMAMPFYKGLLDKLGIEMEFIKAGKYKSGYSSLSEEKMSDEDKEQFDSILEDIYINFINEVSKARQINPEQLKQIINQGNIMAKDARDLKLVDQIAYFDEVYDISNELIGNKEKNNSKEKEFINLLDRLDYNYSWNINNKIAIINISGEIVEGESSIDFLFGTQTSGAKTISRVIKQAREDDSIKAIILRIDSPGGSALASDIILREVELTRKEKKAVIVSMGDIATSGGYWICSNADKIIASPFTITGSIGVFIGKVNLEKLYKNLGIKHEVLKKGDYSDLFAEYRSFTPEEKKLLQKQINEYYKIFLNKVSTGRNLPIEEVEKIAQGRIYTGNQALKLKLIDEIGGLQKAISIAQTLAGLGDSEFEIISLPSKLRFFEEFFRTDSYSKKINFLK